MLLPGQSHTLEADAAALELNPAQAAWLRSYSLLLGHTELRSDSRFLGTGTGLFYAQRLPLVPVTLSLGAQVLRPARGFGDRYPDMGKLSLGLASDLAPWLSVGLAGHVFVAPGADGVNGLATLDAGLSLRLASFLSLALVVRDLTNPSWAGLPLQRLWDVEMGFRPLQTSRLGLALGVQVGERRGDVAPRIILQGSPVPGLTLFADAVWLRRDLDDGDGVERLQDDLRVTAGLRLDFERVGFAAAFVGGAHNRPGGAAAGGSAWMRISHARHTSVSQGRHRVLLVDIEGVKDTRGHWAQVEALHRAAALPGIRAVVLKLGASPAWARGEELRDAIHALRRAGKRVVVYLYSATGRGYYVAAAADQVLLFPGGGLRFSGLSSSRIYVKTLLDRLGIRAEVVRHAEFKDAPEMFTRTGPSEPSRTARDALLDDVSGRLYEALAARSKIQDVAAARALLNKGPFTAAEALRHGLVDALLWPDKVPEHVTKLLGSQVSMERLPAGPAHATHWGRRPAVAILAVEGDIVEGRSRHIPLIDRRTAGAKTLLAALGQLAADPRVKAVVLRVNSGGGSALGSEVIWRVVQKLKGSKPVVASLGDVAASGGYYVAVPASRIYASPSTITGSIGIFAGKVDLSGVLSKLGVTVETQRRGSRADVDSLYRGYTPDERKALEKKLQYYYHRFVDAVAKGRGGLGTRTKVEPLARGRVWTGRQARQRGLVDAEGGLWEAVQAARRMAGLVAGDGHEVIVLPRPRPSLLTRAVKLLGPSTKDPTGGLSALVEKVLSPFDSLPTSLWLSPADTPLARMPWDIHIR